MKKRIATLFVSLTLALASLGLVAVPAFADDEMPTVKIDVDAENGDYGDYIIDDDSIDLLKTEVMYELSGNTEKQVVADNSSDPDDKFFYLRLNGVMVEGGIAAQDEDNFLLCIEVPDGTSNNVETLQALCLYISGGGSLYAETLNVGPAKSDAPTAEISFFRVHDAQIEVQHDANAKTSCFWTGNAELSGNASVTYVSAGDYASLRVHNAGEAKEAITIEDNAKLYCLQLNEDLPSNKYVDGLQIVKGKLLLSDNAFLQAEARPLADGLEGEGGVAVYTSEDIEIKDRASIVANGAGWGICTGGHLSVSGPSASLSASSTDGYGIYLENSMSASDGATIEAQGHLAAICVNGEASFDNAKLIASSNTKGAFGTENTGNIALSFQNSSIQLNSAQGYESFPENANISLEGSWIELPAGSSIKGSIDNSVVFIGNEGTVVGNAVVPMDAEVAPGQTLTIPAGASLSSAENALLTNNGKVVVLGAFKIDAEHLKCNNHSGGVATCSSRAICDLCHAEYGELDSANHANLTHVDAKAATAENEGNIEYWFCSGCNKYFANAAAEKEISQAETIVGKLSEQNPASTTNTDDNSENVAKAQLAKTGDTSGIVLALTAALASIIALIVSKIALKAR